MSPGSDSTRLIASLALSCLLHAALVFTAYLGESTGVFQTSVQGGQSAEPVRTLDATLALENGPASAVPELAAGEEPRPALDRALGIGLIPIPAPTYYTTDQLTKPARPASPPVFNAPESGPTFAAGMVTLVIWISELGYVVSVDVERTDLPEAYSKMATAAFRSLRFVPGEINGRPVATTMRIEVIYSDGKRRR